MENTKILHSNPSGPSTQITTTILNAGIFTLTVDTTGFVFDQDTSVTESTNSVSVDFVVVEVASIQFKKSGDTAFSDWPSNGLFCLQV